MHRDVIPKSIAFTMNTEVHIYIVGGESVAWIGNSFNGKLFYKLVNYTSMIINN